MFDLAFVCTPCTGAAWHPRNRTLQVWTNHGPTNNTDVPGSRQNDISCAHHHYQQQQQVFFPAGASTLSDASTKSSTVSMTSIKNTRAITCAYCCGMPSIHGILLDCITAAVDTQVPDTRLRLGLGLGESLNGANALEKYPLVENGSKNIKHMEPRVPVKTRGCLRGYLSIAPILVRQGQRRLYETTLSFPPDLCLPFDLFHLQLVKEEKSLLDPALPEKDPQRESLEKEIELQVRAVCI